MLFKIENYAIRLSSRFLRRCFSKNFDVQPADVKEFVSHPNRNFLSTCQECEKCLKIAILGAPNAGKSTLINQLIKRTICPTSSKVHTTQAKADAVYSEGNTQLIFVDTPGVVSKNVFMISALTGDGVDDLRTYLLDSAKPREWYYKRHVYSNQTCEDIIQQTVRAKLLDNLPQEIPYNMQVKLEHFDPSPDDSVSASVSVTCSTKRICGILLKFKGNRLRNIARTAEEELRHAFRTSVKLKINVQSAK
ncbi:GTPase Era, mitochondrial isoform X3 [Harpegnathos saltator]|uniref:GTPase Era, mitochondrial isoform X3 n=1 Tax=Harpegnathos saltator TaxID=610380 RepID=UPI00058B26F5|nr:GTPase Era, mitochondrial isoform X3 [Harpegnathos saltator]